jgi:class 3 adenylate cyclase
MFLPYLRSVATSASQHRLQSLIEQRTRPGADHAAIDARIWDLLGEEWSVMFTDLSGFSRKVADFGIIHFLQVIYESVRLLTPAIERHDGILLKIEADSMLVIFRRPERALDCALDMQRACAGYNRDRAPAEQILLGVGLGHGRVLRVGEEDVFGSEVNAASKLGEDTARAGEVLVTGSVKAANERPGLRYERLAEPPPGAPEAYRVRVDG